MISAPALVAVAERTTSLPVSASAALPRSDETQSTRSGHGRWWEVKSWDRRGRHGLREACVVEHLQLDAVAALEAVIVLQVLQAVDELDGLQGRVPLAVLHRITGRVA